MTKIETMKTRETSKPSEKQANETNGCACVHACVAAALKMCMP